MAAILAKDIKAGATIQDQEGLPMTVKNVQRVGAFVEITANYVEAEFFRANNRVQKVRPTTRLCVG
jgi:hypothetical protein